LGTLALLAAAGDIRMLRKGPPEGKRRLIRHLWRMCTAMFIAAGSFAGQARVIPEEYRSSLVMFAPMVLVLASMAYWWIRLARTGVARSGARIHTVAAPHQSA